MQGGMWNVEQDIQTIHTACKGLGTNEKKLISVVCNRPKDYLLFLRAEYPKHHKVDLVSLIQKETSGNFERALVACLRSDAENRAQFLFDACRGAGTDEAALIEVLCCALPSQIKEIKKAWKHMFHGVDWKKRVKGEVSGDFAKVLKAVTTTKRPEAGVNMNALANDVENFLDATERKLGTDEAKVLQIVKNNSREHLWALNDAVKARSKKGRDAIAIIIAETSGWTEKALCAAFQTPASWYAKSLHQAMVGAGTDDKRLIRNIFLPFPFELKMAAAQLEKDYKGGSLVKRIKSETSGDYEAALVAYVEFILSH